MDRSCDRQLRPWAALVLLVGTVACTKGGEDTQYFNTGSGGSTMATMGSATEVATESASGSGTGNCVDLDDDGFGEGCAPGPDCDDDDPNVNPGAQEVCNDEDDNCDDEVDNGCECDPDGVSGNCDSPTDIGSIIVGGNELGPVANIPTEGSIDWYTVAFPLMAARPGGGTPTLGFAVNEGESFVFDVVLASCGAIGASCGDGDGTNGVALGLTSWTFTDNDPGCCTPPMDSLVPWPEQVWVRVYPTIPEPGCSAYQLQASR